MWQDERTGSDGSAVPAARPEPTGDARVDAAVRQLASLADSPVREHAEIFERVHAELVDILGELDTSHADQTRQAGAS